MFVDWNGDVLFGSNDWGREHVIGNLLQQIYDVWFSKPMNKIRKIDGEIEVCLLVISVV